MSENRSRGARDFSKYDSMPTEKLEAILRWDAEAPEGAESDTELLFYVMGVLADRRRNNGQTVKTAQQAYESFKQNYLSEDENTEPARGNEGTVRPLRWLRGLAAAAAVLVFVFLGTITANALGFDVWATVANWTKETFYFANRAQENISGIIENEDLPFTSLQDALTQTLSDPVNVPTWIPEGYALVDIIVDMNPLQRIYVAIYENGEKSLKITIRSYSSSNPEQIERSDEFVEIYEVSGVAYYIFSNHNQARAAWIDGSYECYISGELTIEELKMMIDSIEKG